MKHILSLKYLYLLIVAISLIFYGCSKVNSSNNSDEPIWNKVCTTWGCNSSDIIELMDRYKLYSIQPTTLCYKGFDNVEAITYKFKEDSLYATVLLIKEEMTDIEEIRASFNKYESLGENDSYEIFISTAKNLFITLSSTQKGDKKFHAIGYTTLK